MSIARIYKTKVVEVEITEPITHDNREAIYEWILANDGNAQKLAEGYEVALLVFTESGHHDAPYGWRIAKGTRGEIYPLNPDVFADKYEENST